ncbi:ThiF family adenylyltransferase [Candidatus Woesearchaeota archaeon]|nr:ThiF family adenylyltransferase [Candidatus Woesearchaeota archaeon]
MEVIVKGEEPAMLTRILENSGFSISTKKSFSKNCSVIECIKSGSFRISGDSKSLSITYQRGQELLAGGFALQVLRGKLGINLSYSASSPERFLEEQRDVQEQSILVVGCGGIGSNACLSLYEMGIAFTAIDNDTVEEQNVHAQPLFKEYIGKKKTKAIAEKTGCLAYDQKIEDLPQLIEEHNVTLSCVDNWPSRIFINNLVRRSGKRLINAAVANAQATLEMLTTQCLKCAYGIHEGRKHCHELQNLSGMNYIAGALAAEEASAQTKPSKNRLAIAATSNNIVGYLADFRGEKCACM